MHSSVSSTSSFSALESMSAHRTACRKVLELVLDMGSNAKFLNFQDVFIVQ